MKTSISRLGEDGIEVLNLVVPKPEIPSDIAHNYKQVKVQWTEQLVANQTQKTEEIRKKTELAKVGGERRERGVLVEMSKLSHCRRLLTLRDRRLSWG